MPMSAAATRVAAIEEVANLHRAYGVRFASTGTVCASTAATVTGAASASERGAMTSPAIGRFGAARLREKGKKRRASDGPPWEGLLDISSACGRKLAPR